MLIVVLEGGSILVVYTQAMCGKELVVNPFHSRYIYKVSFTISCCAVQCAPIVCEVEELNWQDGGLCITPRHNNTIGWESMYYL